MGGGEGLTFGGGGFFLVGGMSKFLAGGRGGGGLGTPPISHSRENLVGRGNIITQRKL